MIENDSGIRTTAMKATSPQSDAFQSRACERCVDVGDDDCVDRRGEPLDLG